MFKNYLITALRNIKKNKLASLITVIGFSLGIACALFIFLFVQYELSFDKFLDGHDRIHRILLKAVTHEGAEFVTNETDMRIKDTLLTHNNGIEQLTQIFTIDGMVGHDNRYFFEQNNAYMTDAFFLKVFSYPLIAGDGRTALEKPMSLILTRRMAEKYFGAENPLGKTLSFKITLLGETTYYFNVTGVLENLPPNSSFQFDFAANLPFEQMVNDILVFADRAYKTNINNARGREYLTRPVRTFVSVRDNAFLPLVRKSLNEAIKRLPQYGELVTNFKDPRFVTEALDDLYLFSPVVSPAEKKGNFLFLLLLAGLGMIVIAIACINVVNLTTARALTRVKAIGIRKTLGASRWELMIQYLVESVLLSFISLWFAVVLVEVCLPFFSRLIDRQLTIQYLNNPLYIAAVVGIAFFIGVAAGFYPAFYLSSFNVVKVQRKQKTPSSRRFRELMVVVQFVFSIGLFISSAVILREFQFMKGLDTGFSAKDVVMVRLNLPEAEKKLPDIKKALLGVPGILDASASSLAAWEFGDIAKDYPLFFSGRRENADIMVADPRYLRIHDISLLGGKDFDPNWDYRGYLLLIINETARQQLRLKVDSMIFFPGLMGRVIGVAKDFNYLFPSRKIKPLFIVYPSPFLVNSAYAPRPILLNYLLLKVRPEDRPRILAGAEAVWKALNPGYPFEYKFEEEEISRQLNAVNRSFETVLGVSTVLAFLLSGLGLFGLATFEIERRTKEIGIRKALGATSPQIVLHFLKGFSKLIALANLIAWPLTFLLIRLVFSLIEYPRPLVIGPLIFVEVGAVSFAIMAVTVGAQTLRASSLNPVNTLRYE